MKSKLFSILALTLLFIFGSITVAYAAGGQTWYLSDTGADPYWTMYKGDTSQDAGIVYIAEGDNPLWKSDEEATTEITFAAGLWNVVLEMASAPAEGNQFRCYFGTYDENDGFYSKHFYNLEGDGSKTIFDNSFNPGSFSVPEGYHLALRVSNSYNEGLDDLPLKTGSDFSYLTSPSTDPGFPVPELPVILLIGGGIVIIAGYFWFRRRKAVAA